MPHAISAQGQRCRRAERAAQIGDAARQDAGAQHHQRALRQRARLVGQHPAIGAALAERLQRRQPLHCVQQLLAERLERPLPLARRLAGALVHHRRRGQGEQRRGQHHGGDRHVPERNEGEDRQRRADRDRHLRQVLAEERLQLLDAIDHRQHDAAGALRAEPRGPERHDLVVQPAAQHVLHAHRGPVRDHGAHVIQPRPQHDRHQRRRPAGRSASRPVRRGTAGRGTGRGRRTARCRPPAPAARARCPARCVRADRPSCRHNLMSKCIRLDSLVRRASCSCRQRCANACFSTAVELY